jgi:hypothetical protein
MKLTALFSVLLLTAVFAASPKSLEARHHCCGGPRFALNVGSVLATPAPRYVVESYPTYVEEHVYVDQYGYPYRERVYVQPAPRAYYVYPPRPTIFTGLSFGFNFR